MEETTLDRTEQRIVGTLVEKALTVPEAYPLSRNALVAGCGQKSNRDPVLEIPDYHVEGALKALLLRGWVEKRTREGGRVERWAHRITDRLGGDASDHALLAELLLRGPQTVGELRGRASRMTPFDSTEAVSDRLEALAGRGLVERLPRRPGERGERWRHRLGPVEAEAPGMVEPGRHEHVVPEAVAAAATVQAAESTAVHVREGLPEQPPSPLDRVAELEEAVRRLRDEVRDLRERVEGLDR